MRARLALVLLLAGLAACGSSSKDATMIVMAVWSDLPIPIEMDSIRIDLTGTKKTSKTFALTQPGGTPPLVQAELVPGADKDVSFLVTATGMSKGIDVVAQSARVSFVPGKALLLKLFLGSACRRLACPADKTCQAGSCDHPIAVPSLPPYDPSQPLVAPDAGVDSAIVDSGTMDVDGVAFDAGALDSRRLDAVVKDLGIDQAADAPLPVGGTGGSVDTGGASGSGGSATGGLSGGGASVSGSTGLGGAIGGVRAPDAAAYDGGQNSADVPPGYGGSAGTVGGTATLGPMGSGGLVGSGGAADMGGDVGSGGAAGTSGTTGSAGSTAACQESATRCSGNGVQPCVSGQYGPVVSCGVRQTCTGPEGSAKCTCSQDPLCAALGDTCASTTRLAKCAQDENGCYYQMTVSTCSNGACSGSAGAALCCTNACTAGQATCLSTTTLQTCTVGANGCTAMSDLTCSNGACTGPAGTASCCSNQCTVGQANCASTTTLKICQVGANGCTAYSDRACTNGLCTGPAGTASCCTNACTPNATQCASGTSLQTCTGGTTACSAWTSAACASSTVCERIAPASCEDPSWAAWPIPNSQADVSAGAPNLASYTDNGDGTITDNVTKLMWQKEGSSTRYQWVAATDQCPTEDTGGHSDWRLPTVVELMSIVDQGRYAPAIDDTYFHGTFSASPAGYWSSSRVAGSTGGVYYVNFEYGFWNNVLPGDAQYYFRCVR